jgi:hypothetical protein
MVSRSTGHARQGGVHPLGRIVAATLSVDKRDPESQAGAAMTANAPFSIDASARAGRSVRASVYSYYYAPGTGPI